LAFSNIYAFDGERQGFILGGGLGFGYLPTRIYLDISFDTFDPFSNVDKTIEYNFANRNKYRGVLGFFIGKILSS